MMPDYPTTLETSCAYNTGGFQWSHLIQEPIDLDQTGASAALGPEWESFDFDETSLDTPLSTSNPAIGLPQAYTKWASTMPSEQPSTATSVDQSCFGLETSSSHPGDATVQQNTSPVTPKASSRLTYTCKEKTCSRYARPFKRKGDLERHNTSCHLLKTVHCPRSGCKFAVGGKAFARHDNLDQHLRRMHRGESRQLSTPSSANDEAMERPSNLLQPASQWPSMTGWTTRDADSALLLGNMIGSADAADAGTATLDAYSSGDLKACNSMLLREVSRLEEQLHLELETRRYLVAELHTMEKGKGRY